VVKGSKFDFNNIAESYDQWYSHPVTMKIDEFEKNAISTLLPSPESHPGVLEVGSGTGHWTKWLVNNGYSVTGIDISESMIRSASEKNLDNTRFIQGDFMETDFNEQFDITIAITSLEFIPDYRKAIHKMALLTRPGGVIITGVLNSFSYMGLVRRLKGDKDLVFGNAHFFSWLELKKILSTEGEATLKGSTFMLPYRWAIPFSSYCEAIGKNLFPVFGNFIAGRCQV